jgi:hypothetical protein
MASTRRNKRNRAAGSHRGMVESGGSRRRKRGEASAGCFGIFGWLTGVARKDMVGPTCGTVARYIWMDPHGGMVASQRVYIFITKFGK